MGAGRRRRAAGTVVRRRQRQGHRRPLRRAGRQDRATGTRRRARHRGRPLAGTDGAAARQSCTAFAQGRGRGDRCRRVARRRHGGYDGVLVDAPCTSTGTIRRHPDVAWLRQEADIAALSALQKRLLQKAVALLKPGGTLVYCTCSLEPEEGEQAIASLLANRIRDSACAGRCRRGRGAARDRDPGWRSAHPALPFAPRRPAAWRVGWILRRPAG